jgi:drug/metabolite transporter (DMT)-like permease
VKNRGAPLVLGLALAGVSLSGPLVRLSHAHPLAIAAWRTGLALIVVAAVLLGTGSWRHWGRLTRRELAIGAGAGVLLALHFWSWNASIALTTVAASVVLVNTQPVIVALFSALWLREPPSRRQWLGITLAMIGALLVALPDLLRSADSGARPHALAGDLLALLGALAAAFYFLAGRKLRATLDLWPYVGLVYGSCFVALVIFGFAAGAPMVPQPPRELGIFAALALGPMLLGHTGLNWALKHSPAFVVNLTLLGEPVGATLLAAMLPGIREMPGIATLGGGTVVLAGILIATRE